MKKPTSSPAFAHLRQVDLTRGADPRIHLAGGEVERNVVVGIDRDDAVVDAAGHRFDVALGHLDGRGCRRLRRRCPDRAVAQARFDVCSWRAFYQL